MKLAQKIKMVMIQNGLDGSYKELSDILGISIPSVVNKLKERQPFKLKEIKTFAERFNLSADKVWWIFF